MTAEPNDEAPRRRRKLSAILMADVSGFSRMMGANEEATITLIREFHERVKLTVEELEGRVVDTAGDSVLAEFDSVMNAVGCARRIQERQADVNEVRSPEARIETRIGVHLGDVVVEDYRVYGDGVNIAARLEPLADPGGICISEAVYQQVRGKLDVPVEDLGVRELKNIEHPIRIYRLAPLRPSSPPVTPAAKAPPPSAAAIREDLARASIVVPGIVAVFLIASPLILFSTAGALPTGGAVLLSVVLGRVWARRSGRAGNLLIALGAAIASGALWTDWSRVTNALFVLAGVIIAAVGATAGKRKLDFPGG